MCALEVLDPGTQEERGAERRNEICANANSQCGSG
jgi:hypothetical protein